MTETAAATGDRASGPFFAARVHTIRSGDTLWGLAESSYTDPFLWPHIWNHNPDIADPDRLEPRDRLRLPALQGEPGDLTPADRQSIAEGYLRLYRFFLARGADNPRHALVGVRHFDPAVMPEDLRAARGSDRVAAAFRARLEARSPLDP